MSLLSWCEMDDSAWCTSVPGITMGDRRFFCFSFFSFLFESIGRQGKSPRETSAHVVLQQKRKIHSQKKNVVGIKTPVRGAT